MSKPTTRPNPDSGPPSGFRKRKPKAKTGFFEQVYQVVAAIPRGKVATYGQIARRLGGFYSGRTVGFAMRAAPPERRLPCHRVVNKAGEMAPGHCFGGAEEQRRMLRKEGVKFLSDGKIDMAASQLPDAMVEDRMERSAPKPPKRAVKRRTNQA